MKQWNVVKLAREELKKISKTRMVCLVLALDVRNVFN